MEKSKVLKVLEINDKTYQDTCGVLEVCGVISSKNPSDLSGEQFDALEMVHGWMQSQECASYKDAIARLQDLRASESGGLSNTVGSVLEVTRPQIEAEVVRIHGLTPRILADLENEYVAGIYAIAGNVLLRESQKMRDSSVYAVIDAEKGAAALPAARKEGNL